MKMNLSAVLSALIGVCCASANAATECVWIGGESGSLYETANWSNGIVPSGDNTAQYVAVFTNAAAITLSSHWYPSGITVSNNAKVAVNALNNGSYYCIASQKCENFSLSIEVETDSSLTFNVNVYSQHSRSLVKKGGGMLHPVKYFGNPNTKGYDFASVDVKGGSLRLPAEKTTVSGTLFIRNGATAAVMGDWPFLEKTTDSYRFFR